ncbi:hypothetical protein ACP4OV_011663 [Aristida adscensionis]
MQPGWIPPRAASARGGECGGGAATAPATAPARRSSVAPCVTCGLCGGVLRDATTVPGCLHSFCRNCILQKFSDEDTICCPTCSTDLGCTPLEKLRVDHGLQHVRSTLFPAKKRRVEEISPLQPALDSLLRPSPGTQGGGLSTKKTNSYFIVDHMNSGNETGACERLGMEHSASPIKLSTSSIDRFRHLPPTVMTIEGGDEIESEDIAPNAFMRKPCTGIPVLAPSDEEDNSQLMLESEYSFAMLAYDITCIESGPLILSPSNATTSSPPPCTTSAFVPSSEIQDMVIELQASSSELAIQFEESELEEHDVDIKQAMLRERNTMDREVDPLIVTTEEKNEMVNADSTLCSTVEITVERNAALSPVGLQSEAQEVQIEVIDAAENTTRTMERIGACTDESQNLAAQNARLGKEMESERVEKAAAFVGTRESETAQSAPAMLERIKAYISQCEALQAENARLRDELDNERVEKAAAFERFQRESEISQKAEAARRQLLGDYQALKSEISDKNEECATLRGSIDILEKEKTQNQSAHLTETLAQRTKRLDAYIGRNKASEAENARLTGELYNARAEKAAAFERFQRESEISQKAEAARRQLFGDYQALKSEISDKNEECATLRGLENQFDHLTEILAQRTARMFERLDAYIGRSQASEEENARLREELDTERANAAAASKRAVVLEGRLKRESEIAQSLEAALRQFLRDYWALESDISRGK